MATDERLLELAQELLNEYGQISVEDHLESGKRHLALVYLQGAADKAFYAGEIKQDQFNSICHELGLSAGELEDLRSHRARENPR